MLCAVLLPGFRWPVLSADWLSASVGMETLLYGLLGDGLRAGRDFRCLQILVGSGSQKKEEY